MRIEEIRAQLGATVKELDQAREVTLAMSKDDTVTMDEMRAQTEKTNVLSEKARGLRAALDEAMDEQSDNVRAMKQNVDNVQQAASKFKSMGDFMNCVAKASSRENPNVDPRLREYASIRSEASGQNLTSDPEGGYLVPPDYAAELLNVAQSESILLPEVSRIPISGNRLIVNEVDTTSREDSTQEIKGRNGGLLAYWISEAADYQASTMKFRQSQTDLHKLTGLCYATEEMLEDLPALSTIISQGFADEFTFKIDDAIYEGTGSGQPLGVINEGNTALVKIAKDDGQADATVTLNNILKMYNAMPAKNRANAKWYINQDLEVVLLQMLMTNSADVASLNASVNLGVPIYLPAGGLTSAPNGVLLGRPIVPIEQASALGKLGDIAFLDLSQYRWIDKGSIKAQTSIHVRFLQDEQCFKFTYRAGGKPMWSSPIKAFKGGTQRSPFVVLEDRASD